MSGTERNLEKKREYIADRKAPFESMESNFDFVNLIYVQKEYLKRLTVHINRFYFHNKGTGSCLSAVSYHK